MESVDSNQPLSLFVQENTATCRDETTGLEALSILQRGWAYVVVLDQRDRPQGLFNSHSILEWLGSKVVTDLGDNLPNYLQSLSTPDLAEHLHLLGTYHASQKLVDIDLQPLPTIAATTTIGEFLGRISQYQHSASIWALIDRQHKYVGVVEVLPLVRHIAWQQWQKSQSLMEIAIAQDITAQEQLAAKLSKQNAELTRLNRLKDEFLSCISHELRTPLTSIIGIASLLNNETVGSLNDRQSRYARMIHHSGRHLMSIIDNIVDLAKAEAGQLELYPEPVSVQQLCKQSIQKTYKLLEQESYLWHEPDQESPKNINLKIHLDIDPSIKTIVADGLRVQQMLGNLLSNAFKFTKESKQPNVGLTVRRLEGWIALTVWDHGIGIPEDKQHLIFQKFQQLENTLTRKFEGAGLGLVLTRHLARLHGGDATFVSQIDVGSQFTILLPPVSPQGSEQDPFQVSVKPSRLVLVVETALNEVNRLMTVLTTWGYRMVVARSGTEALEKARRLQPCLILLSPDLPMLSGRDVLALLKQDIATRHIRVVMAISHLDKHKNKDLHQADGFLTKPIEASDLNTFLPQYSAITDPITLLCLGQDMDTGITEILQGLGHHLVEASDVEQGEMLAKIWHPDLILINTLPEHLVGGTHPLRNRLEMIAQCQLLQSLPILVVGKLPSALKQKFTQLNIYCTEDEIVTNRVTAERLNRILKKATGHAQTPTVLIFDFMSDDALTHSLQQYLLIAGFQVQIVNTLGLLLELLYSQSIDALIFTLHNHTQLLTEEQKAIALLGKSIPHPPIIVIDGRSTSDISTDDDHANLIIQIATAVLKQPDAIANLLPTLRQHMYLE